MTTLKASGWQRGDRVKLAESLRKRDSMIAECLTAPDGSALVGTVDSIDPTSPMPIAVWFEGDDVEHGGGWWYFSDDSELERAE